MDLPGRGNRRDLRTGVGSGEKNWSIRWKVEGQMVLRDETR